MNTLVLFEHDDSKNYQAKWIFRLDEGRILGQKMLDMLLCQSYLVSFNAGVQIAEERLLKKSNEILKEFKKYTLDKTIGIFDELLLLYYDYYKRGWFTEPVQWHTEYIISNYVTKHYKGDVPIAESIKALLVTGEESFTIGIIRDLFECSKVFDDALANDQHLQELIKQKNMNFQNNVVEYIFSSGKSVFGVLLSKLQEHSDKFHWKKNNYFATSFISPKDVLFELIEEANFDHNGVSKHYSNLITTIDEAKSKQLSIKSQVFADLPPYYQSIVNISNSIGSVLIDTRKKNIMISNSAFDALLSIVSKETNFSLEDIHMLIPQELRSFVDDPSAYYERFKERRNLFLCLQTDFPIVDELIESIDTSTEESILSWHVSPTAEPYIAEGAVAEKVLEKINLTMNLYDNSNKQKKNLNGVVAFYDEREVIIEGVVRIIRNPKSEQLLDGEILVAPSTTPDYINAINKCKAIITDWGGQTSHAAIVSRELKKSCIIGTNIASHVLKTGQKIKIDFNSGNIEIIESLEQAVC
jgi:phosphohistidine swiveling domain-containing protein